MTMLTILRNYLWYLVCLVVALAANLPTNWVDLLGWLPVTAQTKHVILLAVTAVVAIAAWVKGHWNLFINPDGTPAQVAYVPPKK